MRPECISVRALSAKEGSGTAGWPLVAPLACFPKGEEDIVIILLLRNREVEVVSQHQASDLERFQVKTGKPRVNQLPDNVAQTFDYAFAFCFAAQRAFINRDNFFLAAALIGGRPLPFLGADFPFHFAHRSFIAAEIRLRAAALMWRPGRLVANTALGGRPSRATMARSMRVCCSLRAATKFAMSMASCRKFDSRQV